MVLVPSIQGAIRSGGTRLSVTRDAGPHLVAVLREVGAAGADGLPESILLDCAQRLEAALRAPAPTEG